MDGQKIGEETAALAGVRGYTEMLLETAAA
jgi:hypothetical protein